MKKHLLMLSAGLMAISIHGHVFAADNNTSTPNKTQQNQNDPQATPTERPASAASDKSNKPQAAKDEAAYQAKLQKCEGMSDASEKKMCNDKAKKEHDQM